MGTSGRYRDHVREVHDLDRAVAAREQLGPTLVGARRSELTEVVPTPCPDGAVRFDGQTEVLTRGDPGDVLQAGNLAREELKLEGCCRCAGLSVVVGAPGPD